MMIRKTMRELEAGQQLKVIADDPSTERDVPKFCQFMDHQLIEMSRDNGQWVFILQKGR